MSISLSSLVMVQVNGHLSNTTVLQRSIRQGFSLAPFLYIIAADTLGNLLQGARIQGQIKGISLPRGQEMLNIHFADDFVLSPKLTQSSVEVLSNVGIPS